MGRLHVCRTSQRRCSAGFTIVEIMVVVVIIGILASMLIPQLVGRTDEARLTKVKVDLQSLTTAVDLFKADNGFYPSTEQGLMALITAPPEAKHWPEGGYLKGRSDVPKDPWGNPYDYFCPGENGRAYDIICYGADGKPGGEKLNADIPCHTIAE